jgi:YfiH family protein
VIERQSTDSGARFAFTDRWGGVSAAPYDSLNLGAAVGDDPGHVRRNRERAAQVIGIDPAVVRWMNQVHGQEVAVADDGAPGGPAAPPTADGIVVARRGIALAVLTADCTPVLLADPVAGVTGAAHAGRPGLLAGVVPATVAAMTELGAVAHRITARTGPAICGRCYEVPEPMRREAEDRAPGSASTTSWETPAIDIPAGVRRQLAECGIEDVGSVGVCTRESADHFSYRRERTTGRLASYVWIEE